jgi:hypothetical protein
MDSSDFVPGGRRPPVPSRRVVVRAGAKLAYAAPLVAASFALGDPGTAQAVSPTCRVATDCPRIVCRIAECVNGACRYANMPNGTDCITDGVAGRCTDGRCLVQV